VRDNTCVEERGSADSADSVDSAGSTLVATYFLDGSLRSVDDGARTNRYAYDGSQSRVARADVNAGVGGVTTKTTYANGDAGLVASMTSDASQAKTTTWAYDAAGRATAENDASGADAFNDDDTLESMF
jgi:YD repeat-containing protein